MLTFAVVYMLMIFGGWRQRPRYQKPKLGWQIGMLAMMAVFTLLMCNNPQSGLPLQGSAAISPTAMRILNVTVIAAYAAFASFLAYKNQPASKTK